MSFYRKLKFFFTYKYPVSKKEGLENLSLWQNSIPLTIMILKDKSELFQWHYCAYESVKRQNF